MSSSRPTTARDLSKQQLKELREAFRLFDKGLPIYDVFIERSKGDWLLKAVIVTEVAWIPYCLQVPNANKGMRLM